MILRLGQGQIQDAKLIGRGFYGSVYSIIINKKQYVLKIQHIFKKDTKKTLASPIWREINFYQYVLSLPLNFQKHFVRLYSMDTYDNCQFIQPRKREFKDSYFKKLDKSKYCMELLLEYKGKTLAKYNLPSLLRKNYLSILSQLFLITEIIHQGGYLHNDIHIGNLTLQPTKEKNFTLYGHEFSYQGYLLSIIDYGNVIHPNFPESGIQPKNYFTQQDDVYFFEIFRVMLYLTLGISTVILKNKYLGKDFNVERWKNIVPFIYKNHRQFWNQKTKVILDIFRDEPSFQEVYQKFISKKYDKTIFGHHFFMVIINIFYAYHPKIFLEYLESPTIIYPAIDKKLLEKLILSKNKNDIFQFLVDLKNK